MRSFCSGPLVNTSDNIVYDLWFRASGGVSST